jgi:hypothetical protein
MKRYTAEYHRRGHYGISICTADTIEELVEKIFNDGYAFYNGERRDILDWSKTDKKKYYGMGLLIRKGELEMTEYTSF